MEKKEKAQRRKSDPLGSSSTQPGIGNEVHDFRAVLGEDVSLDRLSELADSARKKIMKSGDSGQEAGGSAQADLLRSRNKVEEVRKRIQSGYYGQPDIIGKIIDKLADDLRP